YLGTLLVGVGWLTAAAYYEDHRAQWTSEKDLEDLVEVQDVLRKCDNDDKKIEQFFHGDEAKLADFKSRRKKYERVKQSQDYLAAVARATDDARRVKELAARPTKIPTAGALGLLRHDPKTEGRWLFERNCANCHTH